MNLNDLAEIVTQSEGKKINLSIAQVKEVIKILLSILKDMNTVELAAIFKRVK